MIINQLKGMELSRPYISSSDDCNLINDNSTNTNIVNNFIIIIKYW